MYSQSGIPPLAENSPFWNANAGGLGEVGDTRLIVVPQARAHSRRNLARAGFSVSAAQRVARTSACAGVDWSSAADATTASEASLILMLDRMGSCFSTRRWVHAMGTMVL
jgi:hypothetical protein